MPLPIMPPSTEDSKPLELPWSCRNGAACRSFGAPTAAVVVVLMVVGGDDSAALGLVCALDNAATVTGSPEGRLGPEKRGGTLIGFFLCFLMVDSWTRS